MRFLINKKIFVTGHSGFKGSWLCKILHMHGAKIFGYSLEHNNPLYKMFKTEDICEHEYFGDINDDSKLMQEILNIQPDIIFHLAAQPLVRESYNDPRYTFQTNAIGTLNLLEAVRKLKLKCAIICITTDKVYANNELGIPFKEDDPLGGYDPYSASKAAAEIVIDSYRKSFFNPLQYGKTHNVQLASVRAGNVIGGGDFAKDRIIPDIVNSIKKNKTLEIRNPLAIRPWQHVLEPLFGYIKLASKMVECEYDSKWSSAWNFGPDKTSFVEVKYIVEYAKQLFNLSWVDVSNSNSLHEAQVLKLDISKAKDILKWQPIWNIEQTLRKTFDWYNAWLNNEDMKKITESQINEYE